MTDNTYQEYRASVRSYAEEARRMIADEGRDEFDALHELVDGAEWVIYHGKALQVLVHSDNTDEVEHQDMIVQGQGFWAIITQAAFWAMLADVRDEMARLPDAEETAAE